LYRNYYFLNRLVLEYNELCSGAVLTEAYSQRKNELVFSLSRSGKEFHLIFSVSQNDPHILYKENIARAKRNTAELFTELLPMQILGFKIAEGDRIIEISAEKGRFYFILRGKDTNLLFKSSAGEYSAFKKYGDDFIKSFEFELKARGFTDKIYIPDPSRFDLSNDLFDTMKKEAPFLGKENLAEIKSRMNGNTAEEFRLKCSEVIQDFEQKKCGLFFDKNNAALRIAPDSFHIFSDSIGSSDTFHEGLNSYFREKYRFEKETAARKTIQRHLEKELTRVADKLNETSVKLNSPPKEEFYRSAGSLLLTNKNNLRKGMKEIELFDYFSNGVLKIKLDEKLDPQENINSYFDKAKNEKVLLLKMRELHESLVNKREIIITEKEEFEKADSLDKLEKIMDDLNLHEENIPEDKKDIRIKFRHYVIEGKYHVYVGKDSKNNDLLTLKFAKQNDYWFHARSVPGSHVVLRVDNAKEVVPKNILQKAAQLAAFYSKAKTSKLAPVTYCLKKYVFKRKGMEPGQVALTKENVLLVAPETPKDSEFISE
jgi:predicted ribosome quality control (RQC) complex YloA/Tae2 family protein